MNESSKREEIKKEEVVIQNFYTVIILFSDLI